MQTHKEDELLTVPEMAADLKVPKSWIYGQTCQTGPDAIPRLRLGKYIRFERAKVRAWAAKGGK